MHTHKPDVDQSAKIVVHGAREHNLKGISVSVPRNQLTVITGLSGSGKSSLAFDTIYAEGQRRYVESLSAYARNFLEQLKRPEVDAISGLCPAIAIDQRSISTNPRSTVGTVTETYDYLRLLFAKAGVPVCPTHHVPVAQQTPQQIVQDVLSLRAGEKFFVLAPMASGKKGEFLSDFQKWIKKGFLKAKVDGQFVFLEKMGKLEKNKVHDVDLVIDQLVLKEGVETRLRESINTAVHWGEGSVVIETIAGKRKNYSIKSACPHCGFSFPELEPRMFSFNNPKGACPACHGLGAVFSNGMLLDGYDDNVDGEEEEVELEELKTIVCPTCNGTRLKEEALNVLIDGQPISYFSDLSISALRERINKLAWDRRAANFAGKIVEQLELRLQFLERVGAGYLSLNRSSYSLSGGEAQRIRLATQVGSALVGVLYVLDEPSIGLHPRDQHHLLAVIDDLKRRGNTVLIVEHDEDTIRAADYVIDVGPGAGVGGGNLVAVGSPDEIAANPSSLTGRYLSGKAAIAVPTRRRAGKGEFLTVKGASGHNLKSVDLVLPLGKLIGVTGVSGSGKSTLIIDTLYRILARHFHGANVDPLPYVDARGLEFIDRIVQINQKPIGRTPRSTPATYVGVMPLVRQLFAMVPEARMRGYKPGRFSFNLKGGQCESCLGQGQTKIEMHFMSDVYVTCDVCGGKRYNHETLMIKYRGKTVADVLNMTVSEALDFFQHHEAIHRKLKTLDGVSLGYITLGQSSTTLSGGEAQRIKLSRELSKRSTGRTLYILDEPTTGLHFEDVRHLLELLHGLVEQGNTVVVIEHNLDVVKSCDHVIDLGPEGGERGGQIVAVGTPEEISQHEASVTGEYLKAKLFC